MATATAAQATATGNRWREEVRIYARPHLGRTTLSFLTSVVPYLALLAAMYALVDVSVLLALPLAPLAGGFLLRTFILFHDCTHGSLFESKRSNRIAGTLLGLLLFMPFESWRHSHAVHHATAGDLGRRGQGDVAMLTVAEYQARSPFARLRYRLYRNPIVMFGLGPILSFFIGPRLVPSGTRPRIRRAILITNVVLAVVVAAACLILGWWQFLVVQLTAAWFAGSAGIFLFYVQHQYEDAYWESGDEWDFQDAAIRGSSFLDLPAVLRFFSGSIGYHHVHHLSARVPNYNLRRAHENIALFRDVPVLTLREALRTPRLKLWDERRRQMVGFAAARG
jgi:omega-6 fatty acid desaturase (delta-12 desaturase)